MICSSCNKRPAVWTKHTGPRNEITFVMPIIEAVGYQPYPIVHVCDTCKIEYHRLLKEAK